MATLQSPPSWDVANQRYLAAEFARLKEVLRAGPSLSEARPSEAGLSGTQGAVADARAALDTPPSLDTLAGIFALSAFERELILLCAGVEMDSELAGLCAQAHGYPERACATFGLALATLSDPHWSALTPNRALRRYRLVEVDATHGLLAGPLRIDERILHYLAGVNLLDPRLEPLLTLCPPLRSIAASHEAIARQAANDAAHAAAQAADRKQPTQPMPVLHFCGDDPHGHQDAAMCIAEQAGLRLFLLRAEELPAPGPELDLIAQIWRRESLLLPGALLIECAGALTPSARHLAETLPGPLVLSTREPIRLDRTALRYDLDKPTPAEQAQLWEEALSASGSADESGGTKIAATLAGHFRLSARTIANTAANSPSPSDLWAACRSLARPRLEDLAQRIACSAGWDDLILPDAQIETLRQVVAHMRHRTTVYERWGFAAKGRRGLGVNALFTGESGTGKTLAAEVLARELALDLYRIDLSSVVSKYIGESEKNLRQIFDAAEEGGVALLFDEADALFGKRTEVRDSHDRFANIEVGYLLQRIETYQGLAILTTNFKSSIDRAFQRRLRFTVSFPFPDAAQRELMWRLAFPPETPVAGLDPGRLAQLHVTGGSIRNIALHAAFLAAEADGPITMRHLLDAAKTEVQKTERPLSEAEVRGWL